MQKITITVDERTLQIIDRTAARFSLDRSSAIRAIVCTLGAFIGGGVADGIQAESRTDSKQSQGEA